MKGTEPRKEPPGYTHPYIPIIREMLNLLGPRCGLLFSELRDKEEILNQISYLPLSPSVSKKRYHTRIRQIYRRAKKILRTYDYNVSNMLPPKVREVDWEPSTPELYSNKIIPGYPFTGGEVHVLPIPRDTLDVTVKISWKDLYKSGLPRILQYIYTTTPSFEPGSQVFVIHPIKGLRTGIPLTIDRVSKRGLIVLKGHKIGLNKKRFVGILRKRTGQETTSVVNRLKNGENTMFAHVQLTRENGDYV